MKVFLSWSKPRAKLVAQALNDWLPSVIQAVRPWFSAEAIEAGAFFEGRLTDAIGSAGYCIVCVTQENMTEPWLNYEAGAIAERLGGKTCPYLFGDVDYKKLQSAPLSRLQSRHADKDGTLRLVQAICLALDESHRPRDVTPTSEKFWPDLLQKFQSIPEPDEKPKELSATQLQLEAIDTIRAEQQRLAGQVQNVLGVVQSLAAVSLARSRAEVGVQAYSPAVAGPLIGAPTGSVVVGAPTVGQGPHGPTGPTGTQGFVIQARGTGQGF